MGMTRQQVRRGMTPYSKLVVRSNPPLPLQVREGALGEGGVSEGCLRGGGCLGGGEAGMATVL
jgi:hypothetical protein